MSKVLGWASRAGQQQRESQTVRQGSPVRTYQCYCIMISRWSDVTNHMLHLIQLKSAFHKIKRKMENNQNVLPFPCLDYLSLTTCPASTAME